MANGRIHVLLVEDDKFDRLAIERHVQKANLPYHLFFAASQAEALKSLQTQSFDVVLLDYLLGDGTGLDLLSACQSTPAIIITGAGSEEVAIEAMRRGAYDYLIKDAGANFLTVLPLTIASVLERRNAEKALRDSEAKYRRLSEFANSVLHNVSNVLNSIAASTEMIRLGVVESRGHQLPKLAELIEEHAHEPFFAKDPKGQRILPYIQALTRKLEEERQLTMAEVNGILKNLHLIREIVDTQQTQEAYSGPLTICSLGEILEDALKVTKVNLDQARAKTTVLFNEPINLEIHRATLTHILINLIKNAGEALSGEAGTREIRLEAFKQGKSARLTIADSGIGIDPEQLARLFAHGFTTKPGGHGFGLYYCANAMHDMGGAIEVHSEGLGRGTQITLIFNPDQVVDTDIPTDV